MWYTYNERMETLARKCEEYLTRSTRQAVYSEAERETMRLIRDALKDGDGFNAEIIGETWAGFWKVTLQEKVQEAGA
jgi:hypothetical protein